MLRTAHGGSGGGPRQIKYAEAKFPHGCKITHSRAYSDLFVKNCSEWLSRGGNEGSEESEGQPVGQGGKGAKGGTGGTGGHGGARGVYGGCEPVRKQTRPIPVWPPFVVLGQAGRSTCIMQAVRRLQAGPGSESSRSRFLQPSNLRVAGACRIDASRCDPLIWSCTRTTYRL